MHFKGNREKRGGNQVCSNDCRNFAKSRRQLTLIRTHEGGLEGDETGGEPVNIVDERSKLIYRQP